MHVYRFQLSEKYQYCNPSFNGINFANDWINISDGQIKIQKGYAWDGCNPKICILGLFALGTPDGTLRFGKPWTWEASLVHDVLTQFRQEIPLSKQQVTQIFNDQLTESKWPLRRLYVWAVDNFGPQDFQLQ